MYPLITISLILTTGLQFVWLEQLFSAQRNQLKVDIEQLATVLSRQNIYESIKSLNPPGAAINQSQMRDIFLSPGWDSLRLAFERLSVQGMTSSYAVDFENDSTTILMKLSMKGKLPSKKDHYPKTTNTGMTSAELAQNDRLSLEKVKRAIKKKLKESGLPSEVYFNVYSYKDHSKPVSSEVPHGLPMSYISEKYKYNIQGVYQYQLLFPYTSGVIWYRMRYYALSAIMMITLTCLAFYYILMLLKNQRLYARARTDFTNNMTHEFKTPIATIGVALQSIEKFNLVSKPEDLKSYIGMSLHELNRLDQMVENILMLNPENLEGTKHSSSLFDLQSALEQVVISTRIRLAGSASEISFQKTKEPCFVFGDQIHLTNVFYNLMDNAMKYADKTLQLNISCACNKEHITLAFSDNGPGIDKIYHKKVFERFFRVPSVGDTHQVKGSGLGLDYVKQVVLKHQGKLSLNSELGRGTTITIYLPNANER